MFIFSVTSLSRMRGVHPDLVRCVVLALQRSKIDFMVGRDGGRRTIKTQKELKAAGKTKTLNSKHLPQNGFTEEEHNGLSHAVDLWPLSNGDVPWKDYSAFKAVAESMFSAAESLSVELRWGGDWDRDGSSDDEHWLDLPHFELIIEE